MPAHLSSAGFLIMFLFGQQPSCLSDTCYFISECVDELYLVKNASAGPFSQWKNAQSEKDPSESGFSIRDYASLLRSEMKVNIHRVTHFLNRVLPGPQ